LLSKRLKTVGGLLYFAAPGMLLLYTSDVNRTFSQDQDQHQNFYLESKIKLFMQHQMFQHINVTH